MVTVTIAPGTAAPDESRTMPDTRPSVWAKAGETARQRAAAVSEMVNARIKRKGASLSGAGVLRDGLGVGESCVLVELTVADVKDFQINNFWTDEGGG